MPRLVIVSGLVAVGLTLGLVAPARAAAPCPAFQEDTATRMGPMSAVPVTLWPPSGPAPLTVGLIWNRPPAGRPHSIEIDVDGDGKPDVADVREENLAHTYTRPGEFAATIRVVDGRGQVATYAAPVTVFSPAAFEAELQARWASLKAALERADALAAIECVGLFARQRLQYRILDLAGRSDLKTLLPPIRFVRFNVEEAICELTLSGVRQEIKFQPDWDGIWRLTTLF